MQEVAFQLSTKKLQLHSDLGTQRVVHCFYPTPGYVSKDNSKTVTAICPTANTEESTGNRKCQSGGIGRHKANRWNISNLPPVGSSSVPLVLGTNQTPAINEAALH